MDESISDMPDKFVVPLFIDNEDKILGPITVRQFLILLGAALALFLEYTIFSFYTFIGFGIVTLGITGLFAFIRPNGMPFHFFFVNALAYLTRTKLRVWDKRMTEGQLRYYLTQEEVPALVATPKKSRPTSSRLRDLALTVNTGGAYRSDDSYG
jgi:hypothetical protein